MKQDSTFDMQEGEYALSKDIDVALWIDYRTFYGECPLKELLGGNFVTLMNTCKRSLKNSEVRSNAQLEQHTYW